MAGWMEATKDETGLADMFTKGVVDQICGNWEVDCICGGTIQNAGAEFEGMAHMGTRV